jgi:hypothetical protein
VEQRAVSGPRFPIVLCGATTAYNANVNTTMCRVPPGRHVFVARDPGASAGDESSLGSLDVLPPANLHEYAEWDSSGVPDPVMFRRFLDAKDYWFGCSDDSSTESYDPARECCVVIANDPGAAEPAPPRATSGAPGCRCGRWPPPPPSWPPGCACSPGPPSGIISSSCNLRIINRRNSILSSSRSVDNSRRRPGKLCLEAAAT